MPYSPPYGTILADPPWCFDNKRTGGSLSSGAAQKYPVIPTADLCRLDVSGWGDRQGSVLFLWATVPMLPDAMEVLAAWGYTYKTMLTWHKTGHNGMGFWFRGVTEHLLVGVRGKVRAPRIQAYNFHQQSPRGRPHSRKPERFRDMAEAVGESAGLPNQRRLELFATESVTDWDAVGLGLDPPSDVWEVVGKVGMEGEQ